MADEQQAPIDVDAIFREAFAEQAPADDAPTAPEPGGAQSEAATRVPETTEAAPTAHTEATQPAEQPATADKPVESDLEAKLKKAENDLALARKAQAALDRKVAAYEQARQLEQQRIQNLKAQGMLTQEEVDKGPVLMEGWVQRQEAEAQQAEATAEAERLARETESARAEREAELELDRQANPLYREMATLGLSETDVDPGKLLRDLLQSEKYAPDVQLTWDLQHVPQQAARVYERVMTQVKAEVSEQMRALAEAKQTTEAQKAARTQFDRTSSPGPSSGGSDPLPTYTNPDDHFRAYYNSQ